MSWADFVAIDWASLGTKLIDLVTKEGSTAINAVKDIVAAVEAVSNKDFVGVWAALSKEVVDMKELVAAIKAEFGLGA